MDEFVNRISLVLSKHVLSKLRTLMLLQGSLWVLASAILMWQPNVESINIVLTLTLGIVMLSWGLTLEKKTLVGPETRTATEFEIDKAAKERTKVISA